MCGSEAGLCYITDRRATPEPLEVRAAKIVAAGARLVMLREKDLPEADLTALAGRLAEAIQTHGGRLIVNSSLAAAKASGAWGLQLSYDVFMKMGRSPELAGFNIGISIHSEAEAVSAWRAGADRLLAGHIFETGCKRGVPGRGLAFLRALRGLVDIPVWAVGGISPQNIGQVREAGAETACLMSPLATTPDPAAVVKAYLAETAESRRSGPGGG